MFRSPALPTPAWQAGLTALALLLSCAGCIVIPPPVESNFNRGVEAYDEGKLADAIRYYKLELEQHPDHFFARYNLAVAYQDQQMDDAALEQYRIILENHEDANSRINLAALLYGRGQKEEAFRQLERAVRNHPDDPNPASVLGHLLEEEGRYPEARARYQEALAIDPEHAVTHFRLGRLSLKMGLDKEGEAELIRAVELDDEQPEYLEHLAGHFLKQNNPSGAIDMLERVSVLQPDRAEVFLKLGDLYRGLGYHREAALRYWEAVGIDPDNLHAHRMLQELFETLALEERKKLEELQQKGRAVAQSPSRNP